jgi:hypothetical protein
MFGRSKPVLFEPYGRRRSRKGLPRWLVLLLLGAALGVGGVILVQERYLPPRLSAAEATALRGDFEHADAERLRLKVELETTTKRLQAALAEHAGQADELEASQLAAQRLQTDLAAVVASLPPDPRGGAVAVRAGRFTAQAGTLAYDVVLTRQPAAGKPLPGVVRMVVAGVSARGGETAVTLEPVAVSIGAHEVVRGSAPLPDGFKPRETTIQVLDRAAGKQLGMRVIRVE